MSRVDLAKLRAAWWAQGAARRTRRELATRGIESALAPEPPPNLPDSSRGAVSAALRWRGESCLVRSIVMQAWEDAHGRPRDLVIGVTRPGEFKAHAWLEGEHHQVDGDSPHQREEFSEILRRPAPSAAPPPLG